MTKLNSTEAELKKGVAYKSVYFRNLAAET